jgi:RND family efflux transporter MFP subunit
MDEDSMRKFVCVWMLAVGCDPHVHETPGKPAEAEEPRAVQVTVWGDRFEIFLEYRPAVAGEPTGFAAHVTDLRTGRALHEGRVAFELTPESGARLEHVVEAPDRPGIYSPKIRIPTPGPWKAALRIPVDGAESRVELPPLTVHASAEESRRAPAPEGPEGISFLKEQQWKLLTGIEPVGRRRLVERIRVPAVVAVRPGRRAAVAPPLAGRVLPPPGREHPSLGDRVEADQVLALLQPPYSDLAARLVEAEAGVVRSKLALDQAELSHARTLKLAAGQAKSERELQESEFALQSAKADHGAAIALKSAYDRSGASIRKESGGLPVFELRAPIAGIVTQVGAAAGEFVPADRPVFTLLDATVVQIEARVPESDLSRIGASRDAVFEFPGARGRFVPLLGEGGGRFVLLGPEIDPATRTLPLLYEASNSGNRFRIGMALTLHLETARSEDAVAIPESALVDEEGRSVAFVQLAGETFQKRELRLGLRDTGYVQVLEGLSPGERAVTRGAYAVRLAGVSASLPAHGHEH